MTTDPVERIADIVANASRTAQLDAHILPHGLSSRLVRLVSPDGREGIVRVGAFPVGDLRSELQAAHIDAGWSPQRRLAELSPDGHGDTTHTEIAPALDSMLARLGVDDDLRGVAIAAARRRERHWRTVRAKAARRAEIEYTLAAECARRSHEGDEFVTLLRGQHTARDAGLTEAACKRVGKMAERLHAMRFPPREIDPRRDFHSRSLSRAHQPIGAEALRVLFDRRRHPGLDDLQECVWEALRAWSPAWRLRQHHLLRQWVEGSAHSDLLADDVHAAVMSIGERPERAFYFRDPRPTERVGIAALALVGGYDMPDAACAWAIVTAAQLDEYEGRVGQAGLPPAPDPALVPYRTTRDLLAALAAFARSDGHLTETEGLTQGALDQLGHLAGGSD